MMKLETCKGEFTGGMRATQYLHRSCQALELVQLKAPADDKQGRFAWPEMDCEGMCGV